MALTTAGAVKAAIESLGLGVAVYRGGAPEGATYPLVIIQEGVGLVPLDEANGDVGDPNADVMVREEVQVDLYQRAMAPATTGGRVRSVENTTAMDRLMMGLRGRRLGLIGTGTVPAHVGRVGTRRRWPIKDNVLRDTLSVFVDRPLQRSATP